MDSPPYDPTHVLLALRSLASSSASLQLRCHDSSPTLNLDQATHILLSLPSHGSIPVPLDSTILPLRMSKGAMSLRSLVYLWTTHTTMFGEYIVNAITKGGVGTTTATIAERIELLDWLKGTRSHCSLIQMIPSSHSGNGGDHTISSSHHPSTLESIRHSGTTTTHDGQDDDVMDLDMNLYTNLPATVNTSTTTIAVRSPSILPTAISTTHNHHDRTVDTPALINEYTLRNRSTYLTPPGNKDFRYLTKLAFDPLIKGKPPTPQSNSLTNTIATAANPDTHTSSSSSGSSRRTHKLNSGKSTNSSSNLTQQELPIILVPPGFNPILSLYNVKSLLEDATYISTSMARDQYTNGTKPQLIEIVRKQGGPGIKTSKSWRIIVRDSIDSMQPNDWDRVIGVFASGALWQFSGWRWSQPVELFSHVRGYHIRFHDEPVGSNNNGNNDNIMQWNVKHLVLNRTKRHLDLPLVLEFWSDLEKWVITHKPYLLP